MNNNKTSFDNFYNSKAYSDLQREYLEEINSIAKELIESKSKEEDIADLVHEYVDNHNWIIYTAKLELVSLLSKNADYAENQGLLSTGGSVERAYWAMYADVMEAIERLNK